MRVKTKIGIIVGLQVALIITSFLILMQLESQWLLLGDSIDVAGYNRYLTNNVILEINNLTHETDSDPINAMKELKENIDFLKEGGKKENIALNKLPKELVKRWNVLNEKYLELEKSVAKVMAMKNPTDVIEMHRETERIARELVIEADFIVKELADFTEEKNKLLIFLEIYLLIINVIVHVGLVIMIFQLLDKESQEKIRREKLVTLGEVGASLAHDLRNPLSVIKGCTELLKIKGDDRIDEFHEQQFTKIDKAIDRITHQTRDVLDFVKVRPLNKEKISLKKIINDSLQNLKIPEEVEILLPDNDENVFVDKSQFDVVITNLILNALQAIGEKGTIKIKNKKTDNKMILEFEDSGTGIPDELLTKIFEPLVSTKQEGTGLGLVSCKRIVEEHGGEIFVKNNPTTFTIKLPIS